jgi:hypothetical protein
MAYVVEKPIVNGKGPSGRGGNTAVYVSNQYGHVKVYFHSNDLD